MKVTIKCLCRTEKHLQPLTRTRVVSWPTWIIHTSLNNVVQGESILGDLSSQLFINLWREGLCHVVVMCRKIGKVIFSSKLLISCFDFTHYVTQNEASHRANIVSVTLAVDWLQLSIQLTTVTSNDAI